MREKQAFVLLICFILIWGGYGLDLIIWKIKRSKAMENKIVKVYVLKGLNGTSLVIENYRVSDEKIYGMLTPIYTFDVATDDILQAIGQHETITTLVTMADKLDQIKQIVNDWNNDASHSFEDMCKINKILKE